MAGVSSSTVSRVINNHPRVSRETIRAVQAAMEKLKYTPS
ncbi:MAG: LacI family DNA-binding transcriptional regulator [Tepidisphaeraceae bacterium]